MTGGLALPHSNGLHESLVKTGCLAEDDGLARLARHTAKRTCRWRRANKGIGMHRQFLHACLVAKYAALAAFRTWVNSKNSEFSACAFENMNAKLVYARALSSTWHAADTYAD